MQRTLVKMLKRVLTLGFLWLLVGCSTIRLGYDQGTTLAWWWIDGYADFNGEQSPRVKDAIHRWFTWHRTTQLGDYAAWLGAVRTKIGESITTAQVCRWTDESRTMLRPAIDRALVLAAPLVPALTEVQFKHIERRYAKANDEFKRDFLQQAEERLEAAVKRTVDRAETVYGRVDAAQRKLITASLQASPLDPEAWAAERQRRQRDTLQTLRRLVADRAGNERTLAGLRALAERTQRSPEPAYRAYQQRLTDYNCAFTARLHNTTTAAQREAARLRLEGWEDDLRLLAAATP